MKYIIDSEPKEVNIEEEIINELEYKIKENQPLTEEEIQIFLDNLIYQTRTKFTKDLKEYSFEFKCDTAISIISHYLNELNVINHPCQTQQQITDHIEGHSFLTAEFNVNNQIIPYLIDPTYRQFFLKEKCSESAFIYYQGKIIIRNPAPGYYIKENDKEITSQFLKDGYTVLDENIARIYGDSFYNTKVGTKVEEDTFQSLPGSIYINSFLKGKDKLSKTKDELALQNMLLETNQQKKI